MRQRCFVFRTGIAVIFKDALTLGGAAVLAHLLASSAVAQSSASYSTRVSWVGGSAPMVSTNFASTLVGPQASPSGAASVCNTGTEASLGFWSVLGRLSVPIVLTAQRGAADPLDVELYWSGADAGYEVYRAFGPLDVFNPANLDRETTLCSATDSLAFQSDLIFYNVVRRP